MGECTQLDYLPTITLPIQETRPDSLSIGVENPIRDEQINKIIASDQQAYELWLSDTSHLKKLNMPVSALRHLFIPRRVLEIAHDPNDVNLVVVKQDEKSVKVFVTERQKDAVTNRDSLEAYLADVKSQEISAEAEAEANGLPFIFFMPEPPENVDIFHARNYSLIQPGKFELNDYVINDIEISVEDDQMYVGNYWDRDGLRGKGIATSFYSGLRTAASKLGMKFIKGGNNSRNISYFVEKLGRIPLSRIKPELKNKFHPTPDEINQNEYTIDFLMEEDKENYLVASNK